MYFDENFEAGSDFLGLHKTLEHRKTCETSRIRTLIDSMEISYYGPDAIRDELVVPQWRQNQNLFPPLPLLFSFQYNSNSRLFLEPQFNHI